MPVVNYDWDELEDNVVEEYDENGNTIASYTSEPEQFGNLISQDRSGTTSYYHYDGQGSTLALTDSNGDVTDTYAYNAFGETTESSGTTENSYRYIGEKGYYYDKKSDDYYVRGRGYQPTIIRWYSLDILRFVENENGYLYAHNNPMLFYDPAGTKPCKLGATRKLKILKTQVVQGNSQRNPESTGNKSAVDAILFGIDVFDELPDNLKPPLGSMPYTKELAKKAMEDIDRINNKLLVTNGGRIWVKLQCEECCKKWFSRKRVWKEMKPVWWLCTEQIGKDAALAGAFDVKTEQALIRAAIPKCVKTAWETAPCDKSTVVENKKKYFE